jgi:hypothetical protein
MELCVCSSTRVLYLTSDMRLGKAKNDVAQNEYITNEGGDVEQDKDID